MYSKRRAELVLLSNPIEGDVDTLIGYFEVEFYGLLHKMEKQTARPHYGLFEKTGNRTILYSATVWTDQSGEIYHSYEDEFIDDITALEEGNVNHCH